jgi:hypothetical protein
MKAPQSAGAQYTAKSYRSANALHPPLPSVIAAAQRFVTLKTGAAAQRLTGTSPPTHLYLAAASLFAASVYATYRYTSSHKSASDLAGEGGQSFNQLAGRYDAVVGSEEWWMGVGILRWWYVRQYAKVIFVGSRGVGLLAMGVGADVLLTSTEVRRACNPASALAGLQLGQGSFNIF